MTQHLDKRIKLSLDRSVDRLPFDISDRAEEIYLPDGDPAEKLKRKIKVIAETAGEKFDEFTENIPLPQSQESDTNLNQDLKIKSLDKDSSEPSASAGTIALASASIPSSASASATAARTSSSPQGIYAKLWHAQGEIGVALDALNIIISSYQTSAIQGASSSGAIIQPSNVQPSVLPAGALKCEYVPKALPPVSTQVMNEKLALGGKNHHLRSAADILTGGAKRLQNVMANEDHFWAEALRLRKNNWCIVASKAGGPHQSMYAGQSNRSSTGSHLFVHYGFRDVGSMYGDRAYAELTRNSPLTQETGTGAGVAKSIDIVIPNKTEKQIIMSLVQQGSHQTEGSGSLRLRGNTIHTQLLDAQCTLFDGELFHELVNEARAMTNNVSIVDNEIYLAVNDDLELRISYRAPSEEELSLTKLRSKLNRNQRRESMSDQARLLSGTSDILRHVAQLIQHRRHRQNIKERSESFFKGSRPGSGRTTASFGQIQQTLAQRPMGILNITLQALQYLAFSKRIREVMSRVTKNLRHNWWEPITVYSVDADLQPLSRNLCVLSDAKSLGVASNRTKEFGMGSAVAISIGSGSASFIRYITRAYPTPCVILQLSDRPSSPIMHLADFEKILKQELTTRMIQRICEVANSITTWTRRIPELKSPEFIIDIDDRCVGVFQVPIHGTAVSRRAELNGAAQRSIGHWNNTTIILQLDMNAEKGAGILLTSSQGGVSRTRRLSLSSISKQTVNLLREANSRPDGPAQSREKSTAVQAHSTDAMNDFRIWLQHVIMAEVESEKH
ncbi:RNA polymerase II mediator complex subunit [Lunasporangiospora selenospora]|uniref:Mediator of RNA polymerase II transcription subunit 17 n=1 Tax=Lunasporangiospora selenospora TaxID=979761 RepID=A0A9P6G1X7_9FUNG|nr:RNA polymerase II mediator complex subunit [Lunasporangiospora selenospora]